MATQVQKLKQLQDNVPGMEAFLGLVSQGEITFSDKATKLMKKEVGEDKFKEMFEADAATPAVPSGFTSVIGSTWNSGLTGQCTVVLAGVGAVASLGALIEGFGSLTGWDDIKVLTKLCNWYVS